MLIGSGGIVHVTLAVKVERSRSIFGSLVKLNVKFDIASVATLSDLKLMDYDVFL